MANKILITGAGGSFGLNTSKYFLDRGCEVIGIGRNFLRAEPFSLNIEKEKNYRYRPFHITYEIDLLMEFLDKEKPDTIINYASQGESAACWKNSWRYFETNVVGLSRFVEELMKRDYLEHFIHLSTPEVYGSRDRKITEFAPTNPSSPYASSKLAFDHYLLAMNRVNKFPCTLVRPANCYGPAQLLHRLIPKVMLCGLTGRKFPLHGGGKPKRAYMHIDDLSKALFLIYTEGDKNGKIYNVSTDGLFTIKNIVKKCAHILGIDFADLVEKAEGRNEDSCYWLDSSEIYEDLGWKSEIGWEEGLTKMREWAIKYLDQIRDLDPTYVMRA